MGNLNQNARLKKQLDNLLLGTLAVYTFYACFFFQWDFAVSIKAIDLLIKAIGYACYAVFAFSLFLGWITTTPRKIFWEALLLAIPAVTMLISKTKLTFLAVLIILAVQRLRVYQIWETMLQMVIAGLVATLVLHSAGILSQEMDQRLGVMRNALGMGHPNRLGSVVFLCCVLWIFTRWSRIRWHDWVACAAMILVCDSICDSRTFVYAAWLFMALCALQKYAPFYLTAKDWFKIFCLVQAGTIAVSFLGAVFFSEHSVIWTTLNDKVFSNRIALSAQYLRQYGVSLLGRLETGADGAFLLDNVYLLLTIHEGVVFTVESVALVCFAAWKAAKRNDEVVILGAIAMAIVGCMQSEYYHPIYNPILLYAFGQAGLAVSRRICFLKKGGSMDHVLPGTLSENDPAATA